MKILHVVPTYFPAVRYGGPIYSVHGLAAGQAALGHDVSVFTTNADGPGVSAVPTDTPVAMDGVTVSYFPVEAPRRLFRAPALTRALRQQVGSYDIVHLHSVFLWPTLVAARAARRAGVPYVLSPRGMLVAGLIRAKSGAIKRAWLRLFERRTIREAAALHFTAEREVEDFAAMGLSAARTIVVPNGVEQPRAVAPADVAPDIAAATAAPGYALYLGRLNWKKNLVALIQAMATVPALRLIVAGTDDEGHARELHAAIAAARLESRVTVIDRNVEAADKEWLFSHAAMFVLPSLNENFGNTVLEAMIRSLAVIVSREAGVAEVVARARCGLVADPSVDALAAAIGTLAAESETATEMGKRGRQAALDDFGWRAIAARIVQAYDALA